MIDYNSIIQTIKDCYFRVRMDFTPGYLEKVYQNALMIQLQENGLKVEKEKFIFIEYHGQNIGTYKADLVVEDEIIVEVKAVSEIKEIHHQQIVNYLQATKKDFGVLANFGAEDYFFMPKFRTTGLLNRYGYRKSF